MRLFETHAHYDDEAFGEDRDQVLERVYHSGVQRIVNQGASLRGCRDTLKLMEQYPFLYGAIGVHPEECGDMTMEDLAWIEETCKNDKCVAIGEIGLDYYWPEPDREIQKKWFAEQLELARRVKLPVVIHSRDAAADTMEILKAHKAEEIGGVIHCFSYSKELAREYVKMGFFIGVGGVVTFKNGVKLKEVVQEIPLEHIVLETDSPYLAPVPNRGKRNDSGNLLYVAREIASIKGLSPEEVCETTWENACRLYRLPIADDKEGILEAYDS